MKALDLLLRAIATAACIALLAAPMNAGAAGAMGATESASVSDNEFNDMVGKMAGRDTGSGWFDYYVSVLNQEIALFDARQPYGAAGPSGPLDGFNGYIAGFRNPDTGSMWFNDYVDDVNFVIREKAAKEFGN